MSEARAKRLESRGHLEVRLFGHLEVSLDGEPFRLATPRKSLQVLAYLLLHRSAPVSREYLAFLLYPDDEESAARAKLRATLAELPKILPAPVERYLSTQGDTIAWNAQADLWLDVDAFAAAANDRARTAEALELYRGDLLPEIYDEWLDVIRERNRNAYLRCLTERVSEARREANLPLAIETARRVLAIDPWREDVVRRIVAMRYESGDRAGALNEYAAFAKRLREEMNAEPMAETAAVAERIARGEAAGDETDALASAAATGAAVLPFVGRRHEMARLLEAWNRAAHGRGACTFVGGESGIGKSRLVQELAHAVEERGGRVLVGTTGSPEAVPYEPVVDALRSALPLVLSLRPSVALACVATLIPEIQARVALPSVPRLDPESDRLRLFESLFRCLADLAAARPVLLVLEDLHWAQAASIELLQFFARRIAGIPVAIVITYRDEEASRLHPLHRLRREARASAGAQSLWLSRLSASEIEQLRTVLPEVGDRPAESLAEASQGNPLFLTHLVAEVREGAQNVSPASLQAVVLRRIERLSEHARAAAEIAACVGDRFSLDAVREVSAWDDAALTSALDELLDRRIVREAGGRGPFEYAFTHHMVHDAIAGAIPHKHAAVRRRRVARVLEELYPERFSELSASLGAHYETAGDAENAGRCYLEAARRSIAIGALQEARMACGRALALELALPMRAELLLQNATLEARGGDRDARAAVLRELERTDAQVGDPVVHRSALLARIDFASALGELTAHESAVRELRACVPDGDARWQAEAHLAQSKLEFRKGRLREAYTAAEAAIECSRAAGDETNAARALCFLAQIEAHRGHLRAAEGLFDEAAQLAKRADDTVLEHLALTSGWVVAYQRRESARCESVAQRCLELGRKLGDRYAEAQAHGRIGASLTLSGAHYAQARRHFDEAARISAESGNLSGTAAQLMNRAILETRVGFFERAVDATERAVEIFIRGGDARGHAGGLSNLVLLYAFTGRAEAARKAANEALELIGSGEFGLIEASVYENLASAEAGSGNYQRAIELAERSLEPRSRSESLVWASTTLADLAIWNATLGRLDAAREAVERLYAQEATVEHGTDWPAYCFWAAAQVFRLDGRAAESARALDRARRLMLNVTEQLEPEDRAQFLAIPWNAQILRAVDEDVWPPLCHGELVEP